MQTKTKASGWALAIATTIAGLILTVPAHAATVTSVSPEYIWTNQSNNVTITGSGFNNITRIILFRCTDYRPADEIRTVDVDFNVLSDNQAEIYVPAGLRTGWYDLWIYGNDGGGGVENALWIGSTVTPNISQLDYSSSKKAKKNISLYFKGLVLGKKKNWLTVRFNGHKAKVKKVNVKGNNSIVVVQIKYRKWKRGTYELSLRWKNKVREEIDWGDDVIYRNRWISGTESYSNVFEII